ncbi:Hypothetical predicted protein [Mytilus galloprovincialis]|uniref:Ig-like domain-containing protein n=1 Tax=Mytilus galloprovincialis TaxID=29158 RepID=A0A8B6FPW1_MYTGA|nr:Hypothetical predicted protein [Mytilus galloprovincialis]
MWFFLYFQIYVGHEAITTFDAFYKLSYDASYFYLTQGIDHLPRYNSNQTVSGDLEWTVTGKATYYGQNVTLFCHVPNCCPKDAGWDRWTPVQQTLFIDVKTGRPNKKYDGKPEKDGYTLIIQNLTKDDLNVSYSCLYGVTLGPSKFLLEEDVFTDKTDNKPTGRFSGIQIRTTTPDTLTDRQYHQTDRHTRQPDRQDNQTRPPIRQTDRHDQTDRQTERQTDRQTRPPGRQSNKYNKVSYSSSSQVRNLYNQSTLDE